jgi:hypothetical protein
MALSRVPVPETAAVPQKSPFVLDTEVASSQKAPVIRKARTPRARVERSTPSREIETGKAAACDEVLALIDPSAPRCPGMEDIEKPAAAPEDESHPYRLTRAQIIEPMRSISGRVRACYERFDYSGIATVRVTLEASGDIRRATIADGGQEFQDCVLDHVRGLDFPELEQPFTFAFPFTER